MLQLVDFIVRDGTAYSVFEQVGPLPQLEWQPSKNAERRKLAKERAKPKGNQAEPSRVLTSLLSRLPA